MKYIYNLKNICLILTLLHHIFIKFVIYFRKIFMVWFATHGFNWMKIHDTIIIINIFAKRSRLGPYWPAIKHFLLLTLFRPLACYCHYPRFWKVLNPFPHTTFLQQTTLNIFCQKIKNLYNWMNNLWLKVENIVSKGEIVRFEQFLLLSLCFQKAVCCRGVRKRLYEGKG